MNILLIGSGGREHALARALSRSPKCSMLYIAPGNAGTIDSGMNIRLDTGDFSAVESFCISHHIGMVVVGPEKPLVDGLSDFLVSRNIPVIGPSAKGAQLEGSKAFSKAFMQRHGIPTAAYREFQCGSERECEAYLRQHSLPIVVKASGLAAGKGVVICETADEAVQVTKEMLSGSAFGEAGKTVVIEAFLRGIEVSVFVLTDGKDWILLPEAKDYKRIGEGDTGPNTGGMGAVSPVPFANAAFMDKVRTRIIEPTVRGLADEGIPYCGFIFFGLMNVDGDPWVIEYNCRMGDPETEVVFPRIQSDVVSLFEAALNHQLHAFRLETDARTCATAMLVSGGYPGDYEKGKRIEIAGTGEDSTFLLHAGTDMRNGDLVTSGGRVMAVTALGETRQEALEAVYRRIGDIRF